MTPTAPDLLRVLTAHTRSHGLPPPAALIGDWADADAVIAPSIDIRPGVPPPNHPDRFWLGYLGFPVRSDESVLPPTAGGLIDHLLVLRDGRWHEVVASDGHRAPDWVRDCLARLDVPRGGDTAGPNNSSDRYDTAGRDADIDGAWSARWAPPERAPHRRAVESCLAAIRAGEIYQACVCTRFTGRIDGSTTQFYADLTAATTPAKSALLHGDWGTVASFSPETFLSRRGDTVTSAPIKGTLPADADPDVLSASSKDIAENIMIVDLVRNDLSRVAHTGTVRVTELLDVVAAPGVWHLVSRVAATVPREVGNDRLLAATFPPASVTGTPKLRAMELLAEWEADNRGVYCGAIGLAGPDGLLDLNVAIRTVQIAPDGAATLGVGGGITVDSDPGREWQECLDKAASVVGHRPRSCSSSAR
ncbi:aminodeoxychorismate synthase component I [Gordonia sinesedis]